MKTLAFAIALLAGSAAFAQIGVTAEPQAWEGDGKLTTAFETEGATSGAWSAPAPVAAAAVSPTGAQLVLPANRAPERDARGIAVISDPATVPPGWNGTAAEAVGGPLLDPVTGEPVAEPSYPACTRTVTDNCLQAYEKSRH